MRFARENGVLLAVRGGGHGVAGSAVCDGGLVVDLGAINTVEVDAEAGSLGRAGVVASPTSTPRRRSRPGHAARRGLADTGVAGLTLAGGMGWLRRELLLRQPRLRRGRDRRRRDRRRERGGELRSSSGACAAAAATSRSSYLRVPAPPGRAGRDDLFVLYPGERAREIVGAFRAFMAEAGDEFSGLCFPRAGARGGRLSDRLARRAVRGDAGPFIGSTTKENACSRRCALGDPIVDLSASMPYVEAQTLLDEDYPDGWQYYWKSIEFGALTDELVERADRARRVRALASLHRRRLVPCGAMGLVSAEATAFGSPGADPARLRGELRGSRDAGPRTSRGAWLHRGRSSALPDRGAYLDFPGFFEEGSSCCERPAADEQLRERLVAPKTTSIPQPLPPQRQHRAERLMGEREIERPSSA